MSTIKAAIGNRRWASGHSPSLPLVPKFLSIWEPEWGRNFIPRLGRWEGCMISVGIRYVEEGELEEKQLLRIS